jgi:hypothetical protein
MALHHRVAGSRLEREEGMTPQEVGRYLAASRRPVAKAWAVCGRPFTGVAQRVYRSHVCNQEPPTARD